MVWFVYGNMSKQVAIDIVSKSRKILNLASVEKEDLTSCCRTLMLPSTGISS
jgi:hypothetical protein